MPLKNDGNVCTPQPGDTGYGITFTAYDSAGRTLRTSDQLGDTVTYIYDMASRLLNREYRLAINSPVGQTKSTDTLTYDLSGKVLTGHKGRYNNTVSMSYDEAGRHQSESLTIDNVTYEIATAYDLASRRTGMTYPDGTIVEAGYTSTNNLASLTYQGQVVNQRTYDDAHRLLTNSLVSPQHTITKSFTYQNDNLVTAINNNGLSDADFSYTYDVNKNKLSETISGIMQSFSFTAGVDAKDRLTSWQRGDNNKSQSWDLSAQGDWNTFTETGSTPKTETRVHNPAHTLASINNINLTTDVRGAMTSHPAGHTLNWDADLKVRTITLPANPAMGEQGTHNYEYDILGRRIAKNVYDQATQTLSKTIFVHSGNQIMAEYQGGTAASSPLHKYVYGSYIDEPVVMIDRTAAGSIAAGAEEIFYYHTNNQYSVTAITDATGAVVERYIYDAYGDMKILTPDLQTVRSTSVLGNRYTYTGREFDSETGLYHYRARMYCAKLGRFLSRDPIGYQGGVNLWEYCGSKTIDLNDPTGHDSSSPGFVWHYYYGKGTDYDLIKNGFLEQLKSLTNSQFDTKDINNIKSLFKNVPNCFITFVKEKDKKTFKRDWTSKIFSLGDGTFEVSYDCSWSLSCRTCKVCNERKSYVYEETLSCNFTFKVRDKFANPADFFDTLDKPWEPGGTPYDIVADWQDKYEKTFVYFTPCDPNNNEEF